MNHITLDIKDIVKNNLNKKRESILKESISFDNVVNNDIIQEHIEKSIQLIYEGYDINEITDYLTQAGQKLEKVTGSDFDYGQMFKESLVSMAKEFGIKWLLDYIGFNPTLATVIAQGAADISLRDLLLPFKNKEFCNQHLPNLLDAILEVIVRHYGNKLIWGKIPKPESYDTSTYNWLDVFTSAPAGNIAGELIRQTQTSESLAKVICPIIHK